MAVTRQQRAEALSTQAYQPVEPPVVVVVVATVVAVVLVQREARMGPRCSSPISIQHKYASHPIYEK